MQRLLLSCGEEGGLRLREVPLGHHQSLCLILKTGSPVESGDSLTSRGLAGSGRSVPTYVWPGGLRGLAPGAALRGGPRTWP